MYTYLYKKTTSEDWLDISCLVNSSKTTIVNGICTKDFKSTTNTASFEVIPVNAYMGIYKQILEDILTAQSDMTIKLEAKILVDEVIVASGYIDLASVSIQSTKVAGRIKISIRDYIIDLDRKCKANLVREDVYLSILIQELLEMAGITAVLNADIVTDKVQHFVITEDDDNTFRDVIDTLLFELGNRVLYRDPSDGSYNIIPVSATDTPTKIVSYLVNKSLSTTSKIWDHDGVLVKYPTVESKDNMSMYIDEASVDDKGKAVLSKGFYPTDGDITATFQDYKKDILDYNYNSKISRRQNGDLDLLYVKNAHVEISPKDTFTFPLIPDVGLDVNPKFYPRKAQCLLMNDTGKEATLKQFDIIGTAVYRSAVNSYTIPESPTQPMEYEASYIETEAEAEAFATRYLNLCKYGSTIATWSTTADMESYPVGKPVIVRHKADDNLSQGFTVISVEIAMDNGIAIRKYVAIANSNYNAYKGVANRSKPTGSTSKIIVKDVQQFYLSTDEETPTGGEWSEETIANPPRDKYLFTRRYVRYLDGSEYVGSYYRVGVGADGRPAMTLQLSRLTYHYTSKGELSPSDQMVTATVTGIPALSPIHWKINGELLETQETTIEIPPSYMKNRDYIDIEVSLDAMRVTGTIVRVMDGVDYIPIVQYRYSSSKDEVDADSSVVMYGDSAVMYGNYTIAYGEPWTDTVPVGEQYKDMYLWKRTWSYSVNSWLYERVNDIAVVFEIYPSTYTYPISKRATAYIKIGFTYMVQGISGAISWSTSVGTFVGSTLVLPADIESTSVTVTATYGGLERSITLNGIAKGDDEPVYGGILLQPPEPGFPDSPIEGELVDGDYYMRVDGVPIRYNGETKTWVELKVNDRNHAEILKKCGEDWIADGRKVEKSMAAVYGYFQQLYADSVVAESIDTDALKADSIDGTKIKAESIDATRIKAGSVTADKINTTGLEVEHLKVEDTSKKFKTEIKGEDDTSAVFDVQYDRGDGLRTIFKIAPSSGRIFMGRPNADATAPETGFMYDPNDDTISTKGGKFKVNAEGAMEASDVNISGSAIITEGVWQSKLDCPSFSSLPSSGGTEREVNCSGNAQDQFVKLRNLARDLTGGYRRTGILPCKHSLDAGIVYTDLFGDYEGTHYFYNKDMREIGSVYVSHGAFGMDYYSSWGSAFTVTVTYGAGDVFTFKNLPDNKTGLQPGQVYKDSNGFLKIV